MTDEIAELKAELERVKTAMRPADPAVMEQAIKEWQNAMHQMSEARRSRASAFSREDLRKMEEATPADMIQDLVQHGTVQAPSAAGTSGLVTKVSGNPGLPGSTGWRTAAPITSPPGVALADKLMDAQDSRDRHERMVEEARRRAMLK